MKGNSLNSQQIKFTFSLVVYLIIIWFLASPEFKYNSPEILNSTSNLDGGTWTLVGPLTNLEIEGDQISVVPNRKVATSVSKEYMLPPYQSSTLYVRISGAVESNALYLDKTLYTEPSLFLFWFGNNEIDRYWIGPVSVLTTDQSKKLVTKIIKAPSNATSVHSGLLLRQFSSELKLNGLKVEVLKISNIYFISTVLLVTFSLIYLINKLVELFSAYGKGFGFTLLSTLLVVLTGLLLSGDIVNRSVLMFLRTFNLPINSNGHHELGDLFSYGHVLAFLIITYLTLIISNKLKVNLILVLANLFTIILISEALQRHRVDRLVEINDVVLDMIGVCLGFLVWRLRLWCIKTNPHVV